MASELISITYVKKYHRFKDFIIKYPSEQP